MSNPWTQPDSTKSAPPVLHLTPQRPACASNVVNDLQAVDTPCVVHIGALTAVGSVWRKCVFALKEEEVELLQGDPWPPLDQRQDPDVGPSDEEVEEALAQQIPAVQVASSSSLTQSVDVDVPPRAL